MNLQPKFAINNHRSPTKVDVELIRVHQVTHEIENIWRQLCALNPKFSSPFFDIEFVKAVDRIRKDVEIAILRNQRLEIIGFLPFQRVRPSHAEPVGGRLNDMHGIIGPPAITFQMLDVLQKCSLSSYSFHALATPTFDSDEFEFGKLGTYSLGLENGWEAYHQWAINHSSTIKRQPQKTRAMQRELKDVRFEFDCVSEQALENLIELKRAKYRRCETFDILSVDWASNLLREIHSVSRNDFQGVLSAIWSGDEMVAGHFGMIRGNVLHYWFPSLDIRHKKYSPGTELILNVAEAAAERGIDLVDFGYGDDPYKLKFCNARGQVGCGTFRFSRIGFQIAKQRFRIRNRLKQIPLKSAAKTILRGVYPGFGQWNFR